MTFPRAVFFKNFRWVTTASARGRLRIVISTMVEEVRVKRVCGKFRVLSIIADQLPTVGIRRVDKTYPDPRQGLALITFLSRWWEWVNVEVDMDFGKSQCPC